MSKQISITDKLQTYLDNEVKKDEAGKREEQYSAQIERLLKVR